ncbi:hypothetical protein AXK12_02305 [Cephaloticoccus capnophilus]|uniref:Lipid/polyisoprenoid-binding YceI-like domain-containing protein n=1 Tax=Cephaloticoccus capnophilus TaxID=1548208 RepID=A0A139SRC8_9BACT|nr:YceI family protein [Cephaloticoccus capnophilus]KXU37093.1 hypothetical protein AXK12_02305 [Cephaloticoccus capnophilus]
MNKSLLVSTLLFVGSAMTAATAAPQAFDFTDPKGVNAIQFKLDSLLEPISGTASGVSGKVHYNPENPTETTGKIVVATQSALVSNAVMTEHMLGEQWLDAANNPEIVFELTSLSNTQTEGNNTTATATGKLTLKGITREISVPVRLSYLPGAFGKRINKPEVPGDLLVIRGEFSIARADFGIMPGQHEDKVNPEIALSLAIVGSPAQD